MSTLKVNKIRDTSGSTDAITLDPNGGAVLAGVTTVTTVKATTVKAGAGVTITTSGIDAIGVAVTCANINGGQFSNRNMAINGAMEVDQRNQGSAVTSSPGNTLNFAADRNHFYNYNCGELTATVQRVADAPAGFYNSNKVTITTPESSGGTPAADDRFSMQHRIEGRNINRLSLGTSGAKDFVISFYVKASIAGDYGLALINNSGSRSYCMLYPATTSWSRVVLKVPGDTSGTWQAGTSSGLELKFGLYNGSSRSGADQGIAGTGSWSSSNAPQGTTGQTQLGGTNGATWQITGLQVEAGTEATPFEHRSFGEELSLCHRYYYLVGSQARDGNAAFTLGLGALNTSNSAFMHFPFPTEMRATPTLDHTNGANYYRFFNDGGGANLDGAFTIWNGTRVQCFLNCTLDDTNLTSGGAVFGTFNDNSAQLGFSAEL